MFEVNNNDDALGFSFDSAINTMTSGLEAVVQDTATSLTSEAAASIQVPIDSILEEMGVTPTEEIEVVPIEKETTEKVVIETREAQSNPIDSAKKAGAMALLSKYKLHLAGAFVGIIILTYLMKGKKKK